MKLTCICCGERWEAQHVLRDEPEKFDRRGAILRACPCCHGSEPDGMTQEERIRLRAVAAVGELMGDELDGIAATLDDLKGLKFCIVPPRSAED
jgi:hypothetical protein